MKRSIFILIALSVCLLQLPLPAAPPRNRNTTPYSNWLTEKLHRYFKKINTSETRGEEIEVRVSGENKPVEFDTSYALRRNLRYFTLEMSVERGDYGVIELEGGSVKFNLRQDNKRHVYNIDLAPPGRPNLGEARSIAFSNVNTTVKIKDFGFSGGPIGDAEVAIRSAGLVRAFNYPGEEADFFIQLVNYGGQTASKLRYDQLKMPAFLKLVEQPDRRAYLPAVPAVGSTICTVKVRVVRPSDGKFQIKLSGDEALKEVYKGETETTAMPTQAPNTKPEPIETVCEVGAIYRTDWTGPQAWKQIREETPERRPLYGYYRNNSQNYVPWQVKHMVENGISFLFVDWYFQDGKRKNTEWEEAFAALPDKGKLRWAPLWRDLPEQPTAEAFAKGIDYLLEHHFKSDYCYQIDGSPVVMLPHVPANAVELVDTARKLTDKRGLPAICFVALVPPETAENVKNLRPIEDAGIKFISSGNFTTSARKSDSRFNIPYPKVASANRELWSRIRRQQSLSYFPIISTGFDDTPVMGESATILTERTPEEFKKLCNEALQHATKAKLRQVLLGPVNDWSSGSYIEPNREYGFGMYEAIRDTFGIKPATGWPENAYPADLDAEK